MKNNAYIIGMAGIINNFLKERKIIMSTERVIKRELDKRDLDNTEETQLIALLHIGKNY